MSSKELYHYGVKGTKWGIRKDRKSHSNRQKSFKDAYKKSVKKELTARNSKYRDSKGNLKKAAFVTNQFAKVSEGIIFKLVTNALATEAYLQGHKIVGDLLRIYGSYNYINQVGDVLWDSAAVAYGKRKKENKLL